MTTRHVVEKTYEVKAPSASAALVPLEHLVQFWPCTRVELPEGGNHIVNVVRKRKRKPVKPVHLSPEGIKRLFFPLDYPAEHYTKLGDYPLATRNI